ncbi:PREDICTED: transmembrane protein 44 [Miniopterus natalensis]|uniref:transmembrane protein 44 n=1 Tax=Miniopterus natalensis TaxID=291302 RepID=UPI0007A6FAF7|nr:PREDICTED: transmembrane protein 44 [Miniopterus natalensis]
MPQFRHGNVAGKYLEQSVSEVQSVLLTARPLAPSSMFCLSELVVERPWGEHTLNTWGRECFIRTQLQLSFSDTCFGSPNLWLPYSVHTPVCPHRLLYLRCTKKSRQDQSALCAACCLLASLCDAVGAILAKQLTIQVFTGAYLAAVDLVNFVFILFPVCGPKFKSNSGQGSQERTRRQRLSASIFALTLTLSLGPCWALWAAVPKASDLVQGPQRRLLGSLMQDNTEMFGYLLGGITAFGSWASRIPRLSRICRGKTFPSIHLWARLLLALAGLLYASAIVAHDRRPEYLVRATPWFLTSLGCAALDLAIIFLSWVMKSRLRRALGFASEAGESPDTQALLTCAEKEEHEEARPRGLESRWSPQGLHVEGAENADWVPLTALPHRKSFRTTTAISHYMELTIQPVQQAGCSATRLPGDGQISAGDVSLQEPPSYPPIQVIRARVSSSSSSEVPSINSDLEHKYWEALNLEQWNPEDVKLEGNKDNLDMLRSQMHRCSVRPVDLTSVE